MEHHIEATVRYLTSEEGGRKTPARTGYRPTMNYDGKMDWTAMQEYPDNDLVYPGDDLMSFLTPDNQVGKLVSFLPSPLRG